LKYGDPRVPDILPDVIPADDILRSKGEALTREVTQAYEALAFSQAYDAVLALVRASNKFVDEQAPWTLYKQGKQAELDRVLYTVLETVRLAAYWLSPVIPNLSNAIYQQLGYTADFNDPVVGETLPFAEQTQWGALPGGQLLGEPQSIFPRLEPPAEAF
jgi:methionyl-tRNA synthetase